MSISRRISIVLVTIVALSFILFSVLAVVFLNNLADVNERNEAAKNSKIVQNIIQAEIENTEIAVHSIAQNTEVQRLFAERNREALIKLLLPVFNSIKKDVSQFQFHLENSDSFLRLHKPEKFGDSLKAFRHTVNLANKDKKIVTGIEKGVAGFGIRVVVPVNYKDKHLGTVEFGRNFGKAFTDKIKNEFNSEVGLYFISKEDDTLNLLVSTDEKTLNFTKTDIDSIKSGKFFTRIIKKNNSRILVIPFNDYNGNPSGAISLTTDRKAVTKLISSDRNKLILVSLVFLLIILMAIFLSIRLIISKPLRNIANLAESLQNLDLREDENELIQNKDDNNEITKIRSAISNLKSVLRNMAMTLFGISETLQTSSGDLKESSSILSTGSDEISKTVEELAGGAMNQAEETTQGANNVNHLMEIMNRNQELISQVQNSNETVVSTLTDGQAILQELIKKTDDANKVSEEVAGLISKTEESSKNIGLASDMIASIADQTNLLALNAAIEAARAGEAGRGFAVVAEEIRKLAEESANSTMQINKVVEELISNSAYSVNKMIDAKNIVGDQAKTVLETEEKFNQIKEAINKASNAITEVLGAEDEQRIKAKEIVEVLESLAAIAEENAASTQEVSASTQEQSSRMEDINNESIALDKISQEIKSEIEKFQIK